MKGNKYFLIMSKTVAIVSIYYPDRVNVQNVKLIAGQVDRVIVCDNSEQNNENLFCDISNLFYEGFNKNNGLSIAFNLILRDLKFKWDDNDFIIFFDQDSVLPDGHIKSLIDEYKSAEKLGLKIGCIGPVYYNTSNAREEIPRMKTWVSDSMMQVKSIITTSLLTKYINIKSIDFWNENVFLDMADWDLCWRLEQKNFGCYMTRKSILTHSVGIGKKRIGFFELRVGKPFREYYETRDCLYLLKEDYVPFKYRVRFHAMLTIRPLLHLLFLDDKAERYYYIKLGVRHFKEKRHGELKKEDFFDKKR